VDPADGNADLEVKFEDGSRYAATFFTLSNLRLLFEKNEQTGECKDGLYLWASDMVIVKELTEVSISETVADLIGQGEFSGAFSELLLQPQIIHSLVFFLPGLVMCCFRHLVPPDVIVHQRHRSRQLQSRFLQRRLQ
jgi:hypothetical protein